MCCSAIRAPRLPLEYPLNTPFKCPFEYPSSKREGRTRHGRPRDVPPRRCRPFCFTPMRPGVRCGAQMRDNLRVSAEASVRQWQSALDATMHLVAPQVRSRRPIGHGRSRVGVVSERCRRSALFAPNASVGAAVSVRQLRGLSRDTFGVPRALPWGTGSTPDESSPCGKASRFGGLAEDGMRKSPAPKLSIQKRVEHPSGV